MMAPRVLLMLSFHSLCPPWLYGAPPSTSPGTSVSCLHRPHLLEWNPAYSSQWRWGQKASSHFWISAPGRTRWLHLDYCIWKTHSDIATWTLWLNIPWPKSLQWSRLCTGGPEQSVQTWLLRTRKPDTSDKLLSTTGIPEECCSTMSHHYPVDWDKVREVEQQPCLHHRLSLESINIRSHPHTLNRNDGTLSPLCKIASC